MSASQSSPGPRSAWASVSPSQVLGSSRPPASTGQSRRRHWRSEPALLDLAPAASPGRTQLSSALSDRSTVSRAPSNPVCAQHRRSRNAARGRAQPHCNEQLLRTPGGLLVTLVQAGCVASAVNKMPDPTNSPLVAQHQHCKSVLRLLYKAQTSWNSLEGTSVKCAAVHHWKPAAKGQLSPALCSRSSKTG